MSKKFSNISQTLGVVLMDHRVALDEELMEVLLVDLAEVAESLGQESEEFRVGPPLLTTVKNHVADLKLVSLADVELQDFHSARLEADGVHDDQIDRSSQVGEVLFGEVNNLFLLGRVLFS